MILSSNSSLDLLFFLLFFVLDIIHLNIKYIISYFYFITIGINMVYVSAIALSADMMVFSL